MGTSARETIRGLAATRGTRAPGSVATDDPIEIWPASVRPVPRTATVKAGSKPSWSTTRLSVKGPTKRGVNTTTTSQESPGASAAAQSASSTASSAEAATTGATVAATGPSLVTVRVTGAAGRVTSAEPRSSSMALTETRGATVARLWAPPAAMATAVSVTADARAGAAPPWPRRPSAASPKDQTSAALRTSSARSPSPSTSTVVSTTTRAWAAPPAAAVTGPGSPTTGAVGAPSPTTSTPPSRRTSSEVVAVPAASTTSVTGVPVASVIGDGERRTEVGPPGPPSWPAASSPKPHERPVASTATVWSAPAPTATIVAVEGPSGPNRWTAGWITIGSGSSSRPRKPPDPAWPRSFAPQA